MSTVLQFEDFLPVASLDLTHADLDNLDADDHPQYLTQGRGNALYELLDPSILRTGNLAGTGGASTPARSDHHHDAEYEIAGAASSALGIHETDYDHASYETHLGAINPHGITPVGIGAEPSDATILKIEDLAGSGVSNNPARSDHEHLEFLSKTNTESFSPTQDYHPATKKYVDDNSSGGAVTTHETTYDHDSFTSHLTNELNPHGVTAVQAGAEPMDPTLLRTSNLAGDGVADTPARSDHSHSEFLSKTNTVEFTPSGDYNPATKKYVDDNSAGANVGIELIHDGVYVGESVTLDIDLTDCDELEVSVESGAACANKMYAHFDGDTSSTNYTRRFVQNGATGTGTTDPYMAGVFDKQSNSFKIAKISGMITGVIHYITGGSYYIQEVMYSWSSAAASSIQITATAFTGKLKIWKKY